MCPRSRPLPSAGLGVSRCLVGAGGTAHLRFRPVACMVMTQARAGVPDVGPGASARWHASTREGAAACRGQHLRGKTLGGQEEPVSFFGLKRGAQ